MKKLFLTIASILAFNSTQFTHSLIFKGVTYVDTSGNNLPPITFLNGFHGDYKEQSNTAQQQQRITQYVQKLGAAVVAEDPWNFSGTNEQVSKYVAQKKADKGIPWPGRSIKLKNNEKVEEMWSVDAWFGIGDICKKNSIPFFNCECRFYMNAGATEGYTVPNKDIWQSYLRTAEEIVGWTDDIDFLVYPDLCAQLLHKNEDLVALFRTDISLAKIINMESLPMSIREQLAAFGSEFVEMRILHGFSLFKAAPHIVVCAGDLHCEKVAKIIEKRGYKELYSVIQPVQYHKAITEVDPLDIDRYFSHVIDALKKHTAETVISTVL